MTRLELIVPWRPDPYRERVWEFLRSRWRWPVRMAPGGEPWCKAGAVNPAVAGSSADIVCVVDADVLVDLDRAVRAVENGWSWAVPHTTVRRLTESATDAVLAGEAPEGQELCQRPYPGVVGGGVVVARREVLLDCPLDPRFVGWGTEDESWGHALRTLHGKPWRGTETLHHLWHPPQERMDRKRGNWESVRLGKRYRQARFNPDAMRTLIEEARAFTAHKPRLHDPPKVGVRV